MTASAVEFDSPTHKALLFVRSNFLLLTFGLLLGRFFYRRHASPLSHLPGPVLASGSRLFKFWTVLRGHNEIDKVNLHKKYGPIVRLGPDEVAFGSPSAAADILSVGKGFHKTDFYTCFPQIDNPDIFTEINEQKHATLKRYAVVPYSLSSMGKMTQYIEDVERHLIERLDKFAEDDQACDLTDWIHWFSFDVSAADGVRRLCVSRTDEKQVLGEVAFSVRFGYLETGPRRRGLHCCYRSGPTIRWTYRAGTTIGLSPQAKPDIAVSPVISPTFTNTNCANGHRRSHETQCDR